ncbi:GntR family transcriptional regulator [Pseudomonas silvicola]|nr:GntR family transcriptional regulator [Pseudomonas silvicola]
MANADATPSASPSVRRKQALQIPKAPQIVASRLKKLIVNGELRENDLLPAESKLMEEFGVSRPTIREAYRILEAERLVTVSRGAKGGAVIHAPDPGLISSYALMVLQCEGTRVAEVYQARMAVEPAAVRMIAKDAKKTAPAILRAAVEAERGVVLDAAKFAQAIAEFHQLVVELSGNRPLIHLWGAIHEVVVQHQALAVSAYRRTTQAEDIINSAAVGLRSQEKLIKLIEAGDEDGAEAHWRKHMQAAYKTWISGYEDTTIAEIMQD